MNRFPPFKKMGLWLIIMFSAPPYHQNLKKLIYFWFVDPHHVMTIHSNLLV